MMGYWEYLPNGFDNSSTKDYIEENKQKETHSQDLSILRIFAEVLISIFGPTAAALITYHIGRRFAEIMIEQSKKLDIEPPLWIKECFPKLGMGFVKIEGVRCVVTIKDCDSIPIVNEDEFISCYFFRGFFYRYLQIIFGEDKDVEERHYRFHSNQFCEFYVKIKEGEE